MKQATGESEGNVGTAIGPQAGELDEGRPGGKETRAATAGYAPARAQRARGGLFRIIKPGQGIHVRWGTAIAAGVLAVAGAQWIFDEIQVFGFVADNYYVRTLVPVVLLLACLYLIFWVVGRKATVVDFMIATEGEMKKVNWSTRREVWGSTKVVIVTVLALGIVLAVVDAFFMAFFGTIGVLKHVKVFEIFFGTGDA